MKAPIRVAITGAASITSSWLIYMIARGEVFGKDQPISLLLLDSVDKIDLIEHFSSELADCSLSLLCQITATSDPAVAFKYIAAVIMMDKLTREKCDFKPNSVASHVAIFKNYGVMLEKNARKSVRVLVTGHCSNTHALICSLHAPSIPRENFTALSRFTQNRAQTLIAQNLGIPFSQISNVIVWGNCSSTQFPDATFANVKVGDESKRVCELIDDEYFFKETLIDMVRAFGNTMSEDLNPLSNAKAAADHMRDWWRGTSAGKYVSMAVNSDGSYGVPKNIIFSFPVTIANKQWQIVSGLTIDSFEQSQLEITGRELVAEKFEIMAAIQGQTKNKRQFGKKSPHF